jgi:hypothetical protein
MNNVGMSIIDKIKQIEQLANDLGFKFAHPTFTREYADCISLMPKDDECLPIYNRSAEIYTGPLRDIESFLRGVQWSTEYLKNIKAITPVLILKKEQSVRNHNLITLLKK